MAKNFLSRPSAWAVNSRGLHPGQFAPRGFWSPVGTVQDRPSRQARLAAERRACANHQCTCAAQCLGCQFAPRAARCRSCSSRGQRTCAPGDVFLRTRRGRAANETLPSKKELESCPPPYLTSEGQIKEKARKYAASAYLPLLFSPALGQLWVGPLSHGCAVPASRLPPRSAAGQRPTGT